MPYTERSVVIKGLGWEDGTPFTAGSGGTSSTNITETISNVSVSGTTFPRVDLSHHNAVGKVYGQKGSSVSNGTA